MEYVLVCSGSHNKILQTGWPKQHNFIDMETEKSKINVPADLVSKESSLPAVQIDGDLLTRFSHGQGWGGVKRKRVSLFCQSLLIRTLILSDQGPTHMTSFNLNYLHKVSVSKYSDNRGQSFNMNLKIQTFGP